MPKSSAPSTLDRRLAFAEAHRPRLDPASNGSGVVPNFRTPPPPPAPVLTEREALTARIHDARATALAAFHPDPERRPQLMLVGHNELAQINADLEAVRMINATLSHHHRSAVFAAWPSPVFRPAALYAWRDMFNALDLAARLLSGAQAREQTWFYKHG
jgi:hypothetical protein